MRTDLNHEPLPPPAKWLPEIFPQRWLSCSTKLIHHSALSSATEGSVWSFASSTTPRVHVTLKGRTDSLHSLYVTIRSVLGFPALTKSR
jgi:hypothetical protein